MYEKSQPSLWARQRYVLEYKAGGGRLTYRDLPASI